MAELTHEELLRAKAYELGCKHFDALDEDTKRNLRSQDAIFSYSDSALNYIRGR